MTIPRIEHIAGSRYSKNIALMCTGCQEPFTYSVRQYKGDFGCNVSEFEHFVQWAKWDAAQHECFLAGRVGYIEEPPSELARHASEPEHYNPANHNCPTCGKSAVLFVDGDCPECNPPITEPEVDLLAAAEFEHHEDPWGEEAMRRLREYGAFDTENAFALIGDDVQGAYWLDEFDEDENYYEPADLDDDEPFGFTYDPTITGRLREQLPIGILAFEIDGGRPTGEIFFIDFEYADAEPEENRDQILREAINPSIQGADETRFKTLDFCTLYEMGLHEDEYLGRCLLHEECDFEPCFYDSEEEEEDAFGFLYDSPLKLVSVSTGRITSEKPSMQEISRKFKYDAQGNLRDEKGRCLACLRHGVHR